ncbi:MAG: hypothetical protein GY861_06685 [bacterium]|nr:hypothetical protein [bacterium]
MNTEINNKFDTPLKMLSMLISNEGKVLCDEYGRQWKYEKFKFYFSDLGEKDFKESLECLHLYNTNLELKL